MSYLQTKHKLEVVKDGYDVFIIRYSIVYGI